MAVEPRVWLVRHAETEWSRDARHTGRTDMPLTDAGRERARRLRAALAEVGFARVFTSPLSRARETAEIAGFGDRAEPREELLEWDYGEYEGLTTPEIRATRPHWYLWSDGAPSGESPQDVARRVDTMIAEVLEVDGPVALFAHGHVLRALGARWMEQAVATGGRLGLATGAVCVLGFERETRVVWRWNEQANTTLEDR
jgi:probable phosphoglycerate mutase